MIENVKEHICRNLSFLKDKKLLLAVSGGIDSVVMTYLLKELEFEIALAHCNFGLRGSESDKDAAFVEKMADALQVTVFTKYFYTADYAREENMSIQMAARKLRYDWFEKLLREESFDYCLTAHHRDDDLETVLINFIRGTGLEGLTGIPEINGKIVRPLLPFTRDQLKEYALKNELKWREDSSNKKQDYDRNRLRHEVIPVLKSLNPSLMKSFAQTQKNLKGSAHIIKDCIRSMEQQFQSDGKGTLKIAVEQLNGLTDKKAYVYELFKKYGFSQWDNVTDLLTAQPGKQLLSKTHRLIKDRNFLLLEKKREKSFPETFEVNESTSFVIAPLELRFSIVTRITKKERNISYFDKKMLKFPLHIRRWAKKDYFHPFGMEGRKKLSDYFADTKMSLIEKEHLWLLCSGEDIIWLIGKRSDNRYRVTEKTKEIFKVELIE